MTGLRPQYYRDGRMYEPKDVIGALRLDFNLGNVVKYISRAGRKEGESFNKDISKAKTYLEFEIELLQKCDKNMIYKKAIEIPTDIYDRYVTSVLIDWKLLSSEFEPILRRIFNTAREMFVSDILKECKEAYEMISHVSERKED